MSDLKTLLVILLIIFPLFNYSRAIIDSDLEEDLNARGTAKALVYFKNGNSEIIKSIRKQWFPDRSRKVRALTSGLRALSSSTQKSIRNLLLSQNVQSVSYWASNQMIIHNANLSLLQRVDSFPQVSRIRKIPEIKLDPIVSSVNPKTEDIRTWGIRKIQADQVWSRYNVTGQNTVVANIDTGVRGTHEALKDNWRSDHGWFDPYFNTSEPNDDQGHGTHTMGTICGTTGNIGIAPSSKWISCRGCANDKCDAAELLACGQWILSPTNPDGTDADPSLIPDVVSNSWGNPGGNDDWYNDTIAAWEAAGILHVFAIGNSGPFCRSASSPGDQRGTFGVGSTDMHDKLSLFSSKGPVQFFENEYTKPDVTAPGGDIYSAWSTDDDSYKTLSGTSMSTPHVSGTIALILSAKRMASKDETLLIEMDEVEEILKTTTDRKDLTISFPNSRCTKGQNVKWPNNEFGYGRINALKAVRKTLDDV